MSPIDPEILERINAQPKRKFSASSGLTSMPIFRGAQVTLSSTQKRALLFIAVVALAMSGLLLLSVQANPTADVIEQSPEASVNQPPQEALVVIDVQGEVVNPGVYQLPLGARVGDAIKAAGGVRKGSTTSSVNLARFLEDGEQVYVSGNGMGISSGSADSPASVMGGKLNLNRATAAELDGLPGVGPVLAKRIIEYRSSNGRFGSVDELRKVSGIGPAKFSELHNFVTV